MQFNFWWFTSDPGTNIIIATVIWFVISVVCQRSCGKGKNQELHPIAYLGYAIASFGMAFVSVAGYYAVTFAAPFLLIGMFIVIIAGRRGISGYSSSGQGYTAPPRREPRTKTVSDSLEVECPACGKQVKIGGGTMKPDGSVVCPNCFKQFFP